MQLKNSSEAVYVACRMEENAISLYQRALEICTGNVRPAIEKILKDEHQHLCRFRSLPCKEKIETERLVPLSILAEGVLFEGGLLGAVRAGLLKDKASLLKLAADSEAESAEKYRHFAELSAGETKAVLLGIAQEEENHFRDLCEQCDKC